jgi:YggT family protein
MLPVIKLILTILDLYKIVIIAGAVLSWLIAFNVVNIRNDFVRSVWNLFLALTEPFLKPIRSFLPNLGGIDISPIILLLLIMFIQWIITDDIAPLFY